MERIPVAYPKFSGNERKYVMDCLDSQWISSIGKYINTFEAEFAKFCNVKHAIATNNGTTALHLALVGLGLKAADEVIIPTVTYVATANAVRYCGAKPVLVDVCENNLNINIQQIEAKITHKTKGIIPVHLYGHPANMQAIKQIADHYNLWVLEDAAEAHGAKVGGKKVGGLSTCGSFSFFGNKIITTGEGGMLTTNDDILAAKCRQLRGQGMDPDRRYWFPVVGYNYRMTNIQAAIGLAQLENIETSLRDRLDIAKWYNDTLEDLQDKIILPHTESWADHVYWMYTIFLRDGNGQKRDLLMAKLDEMGIETRPVFYPMHMLPPYYEDQVYPIADSWAQRGINLPTYQELTKSHIDRISISLKKILTALL